MTSSANHHVRTAPAPAVTSDSTSADGAAPQARDVSSLSAIVFFDGVCGFCNHTVNSLMARDRHHRLRFAPLQGSTAQALLPDHYSRQLDSLVFFHRGQVTVRSTAVVHILWTLGGFFAVGAVLLWLIPLPLRDLGYRAFAKCRYRLFGRQESCRIPTPEERGRMME